MNTKSRIRKAAGWGLLPALVLAAGAQAQQAGALLSGMAANAKQLKQYTFKQRTETHYKGELKSARIDEIHYNAGGERVSIPLDVTEAQPEPRRRGPGSRLVARKMEAEREKMKEYVERLMALTSRYLASEPAALQAAMAKAQVTPGGETGPVRIRLRDFVKSGDSMTLTFDPVNKRPIKTEAHTTLDDAPISIVLTFDQLRGGPSYPGRTVVQAEDKHLEVRVFTYEYRL